MRGYFANTDYDWYTFLRSRDLEEVNFWQPSGSRSFRAVLPGAPFFFRLKKPHYAIAGFGYFAHASQLPAWLAWELFAESNGASTFDLMLQRIAKYLDRPVTPQHTIGCLMISQPIFFDEAEWITEPDDWKRNIVQGSGYDVSVGEARRIYEGCLAIAVARRKPDAPTIVDAFGGYGRPQPVRPRLGQGTFRAAILDSYGRACSITGEHSLPALEAAHIKPFAEAKRHELGNGILLLADIHRLFEKGYVTVTPDYLFKVSRRLREDYANGRSYYPLDGGTIRLPSARTDYPKSELLQWHNSAVFLG